MVRVRVRGRARVKVKFPRPKEMTKAETLPKKVYTVHTNINDKTQDKLQNRIYHAK
jgi:hypothetical protein